MDWEHDFYQDSCNEYIFLIVHPQDHVSVDVVKSEGQDESGNTSCVSFIDETILPRQRDLPKFFAQRLSRMAVTLACITLAVTLVIALMSFLASQTTSSAAAFGFAFDSAFTALSSFMIIWRFSCVPSSVSEISRRETVATFVVAGSMVVSATIIFTRAFSSVQDGKGPTAMIFVIAVSVCSGVVYFLLFLAKYRVASRMGSGALMTDAIDALSGAILAFTLLISSSLLNFSSAVWFLDSSIAMIIAAFSILYGIIVLVRLVSVYKDREIVETMQTYAADRF